MDVLQRLLTIPVSSEPTGPAVAPHVPSGVWQGHGVQTVPLGQELGLEEGDEIETEEVIKAVGHRYGPRVQWDMEQRLRNNKTLGDRAVRAVEREARGLFRNVKQLNRELVKVAMDDDRVSRVFERMNARTGLRWSYLPKHEQQHMIESVRMKLLGQSVVLGYDRLDGDIMRSIQDHKSLYSTAAPEICDLLEDQFEPPIKPGDLRELAEDVYFDSEPPGEKLSRHELGLMRNVDVFTNRTAKLLYESPLEKMHEKPLGVQRVEVRAHAKDLMRGLAAAEKYGAQLPEAFQKAIISDLRSQFYATLDHIHQLEVLEANNPLNHENWQKSKLDELVAALDVLTTEGQILAEKISKDTFGELGGRRFYNRIDALIDELGDLAERVEKDVDGDRLPGRADRKIKAIGQLGNHPVQDMERYAHLITKRLESIGVKQVDKKMKQARMRRMANVPWQTVEASLEPRINNKTLKLHSRITPAAKFRMHMGKSGNVDIFPAHLNGKGKPSDKTDEAKHAVNLGESELIIMKDGLPKSLFKGLRSATLTAFGIKKEERRREAAEARCRDVLVSGLKQIWEDQPELFRAGGPVPLKLSTLSLLTPDKFRHRTHIHDDELRMQLEQVEALNILKAKLASGEKLSFTDSSGQMHEVDVDFDFAATNFGVNPLALSGVQRTLAGAWGETEELNQQGLGQLFGGLEPGEPVGGWAQSYLNGPADAKDKEIVKQLIEQIRDLYETEDYKKEGEDAYKMAARILLLSSKIGVVTHYNCKSGKDRTGEADATVKRLAAEIEALGYVPDPRQPVSQEERTLSQMFALETGNIRWQQMNINRAGYKTSTGKRRLGQVFYDMIHKKKEG